LVLTNRHVVEIIVADVKKTKTLKHWYVLFTHPKTGGGLFQTYKRITNIFAFVVPPGSSRLDVGILSLNRGDDLDEAHCPLVDFADLSAIAVGVDIGICGFPLGDAVTSQARGGSRFGPVIHHGIISGLGPFDVSEPRRIITFLTDVNTAGGLSGSPVFLPETGKVLGLHFAGAEGTLGYAIPIDQLRVQKWIDSTKR
jgi:Trypsin-like peptidase domain